MWVYSKNKGEILNSKDFKKTMKPANKVKIQEVLTMQNLIESV